MQKTALTLTVTTLVLGVFGAFFRWLQLMNAFDEEGFPVAGAGVTVALIVYCVLAVAAICLLTLWWLRRYDRAVTAETALRCANLVPLILGWALCAAMAAASCAVLFTAGRSTTPLLQRLFGAVGILAGLSIPFLFGKKGGSGAGPMGRSAGVVFTIFCCFWCVYGYKSVSQDPIAWNYAFEILAILATTVAAYHVTAYFYGAGKPDRALIALQLGAFLCITVTFEQRPAAMTVILAVCAAAQLLLEYVLISNMWEKRD